jgi:hypothetical protein
MRAELFVTEKETQVPSCVSVGLVHSCSELRTLLIWSKYQRPAIHKYGSLRFSWSPEALVRGIGAAASVLVAPLVISIPIELRLVRAHRLYRERAKSSDRGQQAA